MRLRHLQAGGDEFIGKTVGIAGDHLTGAEMAAAFTKALGEEVEYNEVTPEAYRGFGFPGAEDLGNMFQFKRDFEAEYCGPRAARSHANPEPRAADVRDLAGRNVSRITIS